MSRGLELEAAAQDVGKLLVEPDAEPNTSRPPWYRSATAPLAVGGCLTLFVVCAIMMRRGAADRVNSATNAVQLKEYITKFGPAPSEISVSGFECGSGYDKDLNGVYGYGGKDDRGRPHYDRVCDSKWCIDAATSWKVEKQFVTCDTSCNTTGAKCRVDAAWPRTAEEMKAIASAAGVTCNETRPSSSYHRIVLYRDICVYLSGSASCYRDISPLYSSICPCTIPTALKVSLRYEPGVDPGQTATQHGDAVATVGRWVFTLPGSTTLATLAVDTPNEFHSEYSIDAEPGSVPPPDHKWLVVCPDGKSATLQKLRMRSGGGKPLPANFKVDGEWHYVRTAMPNEKVQLTHGKESTASDGGAFNVEGTMGITMGGSVGAPIFGPEASTEVSMEISAGTKKQWAKETSISEEEKISFELPQGEGNILWQWTLVAKSNYGTTGNVLSKQYAFTKDRLHPPLCYPGGSLDGYKYQDCIPQWKIP